MTRRQQPLTLQTIIWQATVSLHVPSTGTHSTPLLKQFGALQQVFPQRTQTTILSLHLGQSIYEINLDYTTFQVQIHGLSLKLMCQRIFPQHQEAQRLRSILKGLYQPSHPPTQLKGLLTRLIGFRASEQRYVYCPRRVGNPPWHKGRKNMSSRRD